MNYIENIYICIAAPLIIAILSLWGGERHQNGKARGVRAAAVVRRRSMVFILAGMTSCLLSSYISTFIAMVLNADRLTATLEITPMVEELMKFVPVLFYLLVFEPANKKESAGSLLFVSVGFATLENICYLTANGASDILLLTVRGFGTGAMHVVCGALVSIGLAYMWDEFWLKFAGTAGLISLAATYHGIYNILVSQEGIVAWIGYAIPMLTAVLIRLLGRLEKFNLAKPGA